jgi:hypothetical protein
LTDRQQDPAPITGPRPSIFSVSILTAMHENILHPDQRHLASQLLPVFNHFYLCGGTAIALQIGHRKSIDFDLASPGDIHTRSLTNLILKQGMTIDQTLVSTGDELTVIVRGVKLTFFCFPFPVRADHIWQSTQLKMPDLIYLGSMKAYALGRRCQWKDYVDLFFLLKYHFSLKELIDKTGQVFKGAFNAKLFREQLCYFKDLDMTQTVAYLGKSPGNDEICQFLTHEALS